MARIEGDSAVCMHFRLTLSDGTPVDATPLDEPFRFRMGDNALPAGIETRLIGLAEGDERVLEIPAAEAYGATSVDSVQRIKRSEFPADWVLAPGAAVTFSLPDGSEVPATILACEEGEVEVDFSHPLAECDLVIEVKILSVG